MVNLREAQDILLNCHADNLIDDEEFILLYDVTKPANPEFPYLNSWTLKKNLKNVLLEKCT